MLATLPAPESGRAAAESHYDILLFAVDAGSWAWAVRLDGRTLESGTADDQELAWLRAERCVEDRLADRGPATSLL